MPRLAPFWKIGSLLLRQWHVLIQRNGIAGGYGAYQSRVEIIEKQYLLRVLVDETLQLPVVVTAYRASKTRKYSRYP